MTRCHLSQTLAHSRDHIADDTSVFHILAIKQFLKFASVSDAVAKKHDITRLNGQFLKQADALTPVIILSVCLNNAGR